MSDLVYSKKLSKYKKTFMCNDKNIPIEKFFKKTHPDFR